MAPVRLLLPPHPHPPLTLTSLWHPSLTATVLPSEPSCSWKRDRAEGAVEVVFWSRLGQRGGMGAAGATALDILLSW